ncbi:MAG: histidine kinase, partial [Candidatus Pacebacteria bacterium]|nr:histidine kinase [Candidatus Paceibacterota bacterium]
MRVLVICAWSMGLMLLGSVCRVSAQAPELRGNAFRVRKVLVLHSYHSDTQWTRDITAGITAGLEGADVPVDLHVEYMDTKRYYNEEYLAKLKAVYKYKFSEAPADVLITVDDNALRFAVDSRSDVFSGVPIVFCGVNHYDPGEFAEQRNLTGIVESWDALGTVRLALHLHPGTTTLYVINDDTPTGRANRARLDESFASPDARVDVQYLGSGVTMQQLQQQVAQLPENSVVLMMSFNRDSEGVYYDYETSIEFVRKVCERPMYGVWDFYLGHGIVGGHLTSGETQG